MPADPPRELAPSQADLGNLFTDLSRLAGGDAYPLSFLNARFRSHEAFRAEARAKVLDLLRYRPAPVEPRAELVERVELADHVRERVVFSTAPHVRVPAYVLIPRGLRGPAPAVVDLHSHGGMFLFGKEKVIDFGRNHPAMTAYQEQNYDGRPTATALVRRGYVVITIDAFFFGERRLLLDADLGRGWDRSRYRPATSATSTDSAGRRSRRWPRRWSSPARPGRASSPGTTCARWTTSSRARRSMRGGSVASASPWAATGRCT
jgi:hypothetical protein